MHNPKTVSVKHSLGTRVLKIVLGAFIVLSLVLTALHLYAEYSREKEQIMRELQIIADMSSPGLAQALWDVNHDQALDILRGMYSFPSVVRVRLSDEWGKEVGRIGAKNPAAGETESGESPSGLNGSNPQGFTQSLPVFYRKDDKQSRVGTLTIASSTDAVFSAIRSDLLFLLFAALLKALLISVLFLAIFRIKLTRPLIEFTAKVSTIDLDNPMPDLAQRVNLDKRSEIGVLAHSITEMAERLRCANAAIRETEEKYRGIIENAIQGVFQTTVDGAIVTANPALAQMFGYDSIEEAVGVTDLVHQHYVNQSDREVFLATLRTQGVIEGFELELKRRDNTQFTGLIHARLTSSPKDGSTLMEGTIQDITARKEKEYAIQQREAALASNQAKSQFLAHMSHEIRTPMNAVIGLTQLALRTELTPVQNDYLKKINSSAQALLGVINDILDFSKIEAGKLSLERIPFDLQEIMSNLGNIIGMKAQEKGLELIFSGDPNLLRRLVGDPLRLGQVLINLGNNAVKFTEKGEVVVTTSLLEVGEDWVRIGFSVRDTGIGISSEQQEKLFHSFSQVDADITRRFGGTGLGLAISKQLVEMMGGTLVCESAFGSGSTFSFDLRLGTVISSSSSGRVPPERIQGKSILVVDDNETARQSLRAMLEGFSFKVETAASGEEALVRLAERRKSGKVSYDAILLDWKMPGIDGLETARRIRSDDTSRDTPAILMITAFGREEVMKEVEDLKLDGFLTKPVGASLLYDTFAELMGFSSGHGRPHSTDSESASSRLAELRGKRILLVEDNLINQQVASEFLHQAGLVVDLAHNGLEGVHKAGTDAYDLVLMDIQMPQMDGLEATRRMRSMGLSDLPIIAMTAHAMASDRQRSREAGMNDHLVKPIDPDVLAAVLLHWIPAGIGEEIERPLDRPTAGVKLPPPSPEPALQDIPGINMPKALKHASNNPKLVQQLIEYFISANQGTAERITAALDQGRDAEARKLIHTLKGEASALGADDITQSALDLECVIMAGGSHDDGMERVKLALNCVLESNKR